MAVPDRVFSETMAWLVEVQETDGPEQPRHEPVGSGNERYAPTVDRARGWAYLPGKSPRARENAVSGSMTTAAVASLLICRKVLEEKRSSRLTRRLKVRGETAVLDGLAWLDRNFTVTANPGNGQYYRTLYLYGLERVGDLRRVNLIGRHAWYLEGARSLVHDQKADGHWTDYTHAPKDIIATCFALLFLDRATLAVTGE